MEQEEKLKTSVERLINCTLENTWNAWADAGEWSKWVFMSMSNNFHEQGRFENGTGEGGLYIKIETNKTITFTWEMRNYEPGSYIIVTFVSEEQNKTLCRIDHLNLQSQKDVDNSLLGWKWAIDSLKSFLETGKGLTWEEWESKAS